MIPSRERTSGLRILAVNRDLRRLLSAQFLAQAADGMAQAAFADAVVLDPAAQSTPGRILAVFALTLVPYSLIAPFAGVFVDRWRRRSLLVWSNLLRAAVLLSVPLWSARLAGETALYVAVLVLLGLGRLFLTTKAAALPVILGEHDLLQGNALSGGGGMIAALLGGVTGLALTALVDEEGVFLVAGAVLGASALIAARLSRPMAHEAPHAETLGRAVARVARELLEGAREVWRRRRARLALAGIFVLRAVVILTAIAAILVIKQRYPDAGDNLGRVSAGALALGTTSAGAFAGALASPWLGRKLPGAGLILLGFAVCGAGVAALGGIVDLRAVLVLTALAGYGAYVAKIATDVQIQATMPDAYRGRAFSLYDILYNLASVAAAWVVLVFSELSFRALLVPAGLVTLALAVALGAAMARAGMLVRPAG